MRKVLIPAIILVFAMSLPAYAAGVKIGVINMQQAFKNSEPGQKVVSELEEKHATILKDLEKRKEELAKMQEDMQKQALVLSLEAKQDKELELKRKVRDYQDLMQSYQRRFKADEERLSKPVIETLDKVVKEFGKKNKYTIIMDMNSVLSGLLYADEAVNVTNQIILEMNREWRASGGKKK